jgi:hypothetical protein
MRNRGCKRSRYRHIVAFGDLWRVQEGAGKVSGGFSSREERRSVSGISQITDFPQNLCYQYD